MKKIFFIIAVLSFLINSAQAQISSDEIVKVMRKKIDLTTKLLQENPDHKLAVAPQIFNEFDPLFDYELMAKLSLGSKQLRKLTDDQKKSFYKKFEQRLKNSYLDKLRLYSDQKVNIKELKDVKKRKILYTELVGNDKKYQIDYKFYDAKEKGWLIYDVDILGVSIVQTYRNQFMRVLDDDSCEKLLELLETTKIVNQ